MLCRAQSSSFPAFPSIPHSLAPLDILEQHIHGQSDPLYEVIRRAEACTTGFGASRLPEPKAAWVVWAVSLSVETTQLVISGGQRGEVEAFFRLSASRSDSRLRFRSKATSSQSVAPYNQYTQFRASPTFSFNSQHSFLFSDSSATFSAEFHRFLRQDPPARFLLSL